MNDPRQEPAPPARPRYALCFGTFAVFFLVYVGAAVMQTPAGAAAGRAEVLGVPVGIVLSLAIFPVSWALIAFWFRQGR